MQKTVGVFFGSRSPEHDISIITAQLVINNLKKIGYKVLPIYITQAGEWLTSKHFDSLDTFKNKDNINSESEKVTNLSLDLQKSRSKIVFKENKLFGKELVIDIAFPCFHGSYGEDGSVQGIFELLNIPYIGCEIASSAIAMDKILTKRICVSGQIPTPNYLAYTKHEYQTNKDQYLKEIQEKLKLPVFIKPPTLGSSIGINKVKEWSQLEDQIELALYYDNQVLIEEAVENMMDITCCLIGNDTPQASLLQASQYTTDFFSYEDKYLKDGGAQIGNAEKNLIIPAPVEDELTQKIQDTAKKVYKIVGCSGIARVDFLLDTETKEFFVNEINALPGTIYVHLWEKSGTKPTELVQKLVDLALEKNKQKNQTNKNFASNVLDKVNSQKLQNKLN